MARTAVEKIGWNEWGETIGRGLGEGLVEGTGSVAQLAATALRPLVDEILAHLRREALAARAAATQVTLAPEQVTSEADEQLAALARAEAAMHRCDEPGCTEPALARNLCRRHYSRRLYQERKERLGAHGFRVVEPRMPSVFGGNAVPDKKPVVTVAPIIRRKKAESVEPAPAPVPPVFKAPPVHVKIPEVDAPIAAAAAASGITPEAVARFLGLKE